MSPDRPGINADESGEFESGEDELTSSNPSFICKLCGKGFGSGKALGGHMRIHAEHQRPAVLKNALAAGGKKSSYLQDLEKEGNPTCSLCNKSFHSPKSLFGHMRCHPEREWRGMQPPPGLNSAPTSTVSYSSHDSVSSTTPVDLLQPLSGWSTKKSRRTQKDITDEAALDDDSAVHGLMLLAASKDEIIDDELLSNSAIGLKRKRKTVKLTDLESTMAGKCYKCATCDKAYPTPQALGGHRSSAHNSNSKLISVKDGSSKTNSIHYHHDVGDDQQAIAAVHPPPTADVVVPHICKICDKAFPSGQALGGHKRCHYQPPTGSATDHPAQPCAAALEPPPSSSSSSSPRQSAQAHLINKNPRLDFDLNELPPDYISFLETFRVKRE